ncbi:MAG: hypothetical protein GC178_10235 [Flavobacteriales bacterium]|nr:hypothetical protein [Flavobacteriales bacterium]
MANISLTDFIEYVTKVGSTKFTKVKQIKEREEYHPSKDFWRPLREAIIEMHESDSDKKKLDAVVSSITDKKKLNLYPQLVKQYKSFLGRKDIEWFDPPSKTWKFNGLEVKINPEIGLVINGHPYVIKLYFKADKLSQNKVDLILLLMNTQLKRKNLKEVRFAILDIPNKKLYEKTKLDTDHLSLLEGEAMSFMSIWESV